MLQAHSLLWNYLWVAPNLLVFSLGILLWKRGFNRILPSFLAFAILTAVGDLATFLADVIPSVKPETFWRFFCAELLLESLLKFLVVGEVFSRVFNPYPSIGRLGKVLVSGCGALLVLMAAIIAGFAKGDSVIHIIATAHLLEQTVFIIESGLIIFLFLFAAYFHLSWDRLSFGVLFGLGISSCEHLATWAIIANTSPSEHIRALFAFLNMATYHVAVLIWFYYLLVPEKTGKSPKTPKPPTPTIRLPENDLAVWNREVERLLHQ